MTGGVFLGVSIIIGGQYGSEGKGKVAFWYTNKVDASSVIRVGGINSGHTVISSHGEALIFRVLPTDILSLPVWLMRPETREGFVTTVL